LQDYTGLHGQQNIKFTKSTSILAYTGPSLTHSGRQLLCPELPSKLSHCVPK